MTKIIKQDFPVFIAFLKVFWIARGWRSRLNLLGLFLFTLGKRIIGSKSFRYPFRLVLSVTYGSTSVWVRDMADITTVAAIFAEGEYDIQSPPAKVKTILDLGSNIGISVAYFRLRYPAAHIYAVEADLATFKRLEQNCRGLENITLIRAAIADKTGPVAFHSNESSVSGSIIQRAGAAGSTSVKGFTIDDLISTYHLGLVDILKFDIEGAEFDAFPVSFQVLSTTRVIMGEVHPDIGSRSAPAFLDLFSGYKVETIARQKGRFILKALRETLLV